MQAGAVLFQFSRKPQFLTNGAKGFRLLSVSVIYEQLCINCAAKLQIFSDLGKLGDFQRVWKGAGTNRVLLWKLTESRVN